MSFLRHFSKPTYKEDVKHIKALKIEDGKFNDHVNIENEFINDYELDFQS